MNTPTRDTWLKMTDMPAIPPEADDDLPSIQPLIPLQPLDVEPLQHTSSPLSQEAGNTSQDLSPIHAVFKTAGIRGLLPSALAKEERAARLHETNRKRRSGIELTANEIQDDLRNILSHFTTQLNMHATGVSIMLKLPAQALLYAERTASYAITDYPRVFENNVTIMRLWDALEEIYRQAMDWRKAANRSDGKDVIVLIDRSAKAAIRGLYLAADNAITNTEEVSSDSQP